MVALQILNRILASKDFSIVENNMLTDDYFVGYESEIKFIREHYEKYGNVPDKDTFISRFRDFDVIDVTESERYLIDTIREEYLYYKTVPVIQQTAKLAKQDSNVALEFWRSQMSGLETTYSFGGKNIIQGADERVEQFRERKAKPESWFFESGFKELDDIIHGIQREEELVVIVARTNQGKSWVLEKIAAHIWKIGFNVGYFSPEMSANSIGFRFDTLINGVSNKGLMWGNKDLDEDEYVNYINDLKSRDNVFMVTNPKDFGGDITVSKLKQWIRQNKLDLVAIDGITYLTDERYRKGDSVNTSLTHISEDLMTLSVEIKVPILVVVQANRTGVSHDDKDGTPELESIRDSDGIAHNASKVLSLRQKKDDILEIGIKKQRFGAVGGKVQYQWKIDTGEFVYAPMDNSYSGEDEEPKRTRKKRSTDEDTF